MPFITFEGPEGCGKSTQIQLLYNRLIDSNIKCKITREPGGTELAEHLRTIIKYYNKETIQKQTEVMLIYAARSQHYLNVIKPALNEGYIVLCDRFIDSTLVYQGYCQGVSSFLLNDLAKFIDPNIFPDLTLYIDVPVEESLKRLAKRHLSINEANDRFDNRDKQFFEKVREGYRKNINPQYRNRIVELDGLKSICDLQKEIQQIVKLKFNLNYKD